MVRSRLLLLGMLLLIVANASHAATITLSIDPDPPRIQESFRLTFSADEKVDGEPDFSPLENLFDIINQSQNTSIQWINGKHSRTTVWDLQVIARQAGDLIIPSIKFGNDASASRRITVSDSAQNPVAQEEDLILELEVDETEPYVQQQVLLTVRLLRRIELSDAKLSEPVANIDTIFKVMSNDKTYQDRRNGRRFEVFERRYAMYPQSSGTLTISPLTLTTQIANGPRSFFDPFRSNISTRRIRSNALELNVKPIPQNFTGDVWLPARRLRIRDEWEPTGSDIKVGDPLTRTLFLWTDGLNAGQLPDFPAIEIDDARIYPDQAQSNEQENESGFHAIKQREFAIIPTAPGEISFPEIVIPWWDVDTDTLEYARLEAKTLSIQGAKHLASPPPRTAPIALEPAPDETDQLIAPDDGDDGQLVGTWWRNLALAAILGWLVSVVLWLRSTRQNPSDANAGTAEDVQRTEKLSRLAKEVVSAATNRDARKCRSAIIIWARMAYESPKISTLAAVGEYVETELGDEISILNEYVYGASNLQWDTDSFINAFKNNEIENSPVPNQASSTGLTPLFRLN